MSRPSPGGALVAEADVLVIGGGPAGAWAAVAAAEAGAEVVLADKGYCGTSGSAASGGNNLWYLPPDPARREAAIAARETLAGHLTDRRWMARVLDETYRQVNRLADWGYPFPEDEDGVERRGSLQGPEYMRRMRRRAHRSGVRILDHHPALELLVTPEGAAGGAAGIRRQLGCAPWEVRAGAVVLATGGCAFLSGAFGLNVDTGDGHLMAAELGAELSGMEFSNAYALSPAYGSHTKGLMMQFATYYDEDGRALEVGGMARRPIARLLADGRPVHARLDQAPPELRAAMRQAQPNYFLPLDKAGIDPFTQAYPVRMVLEGTVRGTGGLRVTGEGCATTVPGLFAAGDVATRELITGAVSGGGSHNGAWAISSGTWAGAAAAAHAARGRPTSAAPAGGAGLRPSGPPGAPDAAEVVAAVQQEVLPLERNYFRTAEGLRRSLDTLDGLWRHVATHLSGEGRDALRARQAAAMVAHARWMYRAALARAESRGMHQREDLPAPDPRLTHRIRAGGLDEVWTAPEEAAA
ncbi:pyridine nucleotide-disulfide oxidoreductase [Sphaerisporangium krabiense]|uniref:L-aspartate oxidase n=1 Tax=Sphaerisporangium krabiense TaxID=763782 RepID=A0A7W9DSM1_9ACTN|nr:FAD-binding protein [Sphaerisporangium krabiense]MBB5629706.1 succinate dehydrogenase/fumarate reductase flavoprotein subunit [Sphaerisporangium krabiense]GII63806.1 pyridine nucleotide-disulfide oxidoreductase [Sphaerisporangium krabiense]